MKRKEKVDPNTVEEQRGEFGDKFRDLVKKGNKEEKKEWKKALKYFAKLQGRVLHEKSVESRFITDIVEDVLQRLKNPSRASSSSNPPSGTYFSRTGQDKVESLCGIEIRLKQLGEKISFGSGETTRIIGVVGPPGIGKSTLVKKFYEDSKERLSRHVFIPDVQQIRKEDNDLRYLLKILLEDLLGVKNPKIETVKRAHEASKNQLLQKKAFVVLDNVGDREEIDAILGQRDWIKQGSKIVIATSDKSLLIHAGVKNIYEVPPLSYQHSLQHFAHHAFGGQSYDSSFSKLLNEFMHYTKGNPLALKVLGGGLLGKDVSLWSDKMDALKQCHNGQERRSEKMPAQSSIQMLLSVWKGSYDALTQEQKDTLLDIAYFRSLDENYVASLLDSYGETSTKIAELVNKFLISISGGKIHMHDTLHMFSEARKLQELNLEGCTALATLPEDMKNMECLVILNLRGCTSLKCLPQIDLPSLLILILTDCSKFKVFHVISVKLEAIHLDGTAIKKLPDDIGKLKKLALFNMKSCKNLETLPDTLGELKALQELILSGCENLETLPDSLGELKALQKLILSGCSELTSFPNNVENMERLEILLLDETAIEDIPNIPSLRRIRLSRNEKICDLPESISQFYRLKWLDMKYCTSVTHLPELPPNLRCVDAHGCSSLRTVAEPLSQAMTTTEHIHSTFIFTNCNGLEQAAKKEIASFAQSKCQLLPNALKLCNKDFVPEILFSTCFPGAQIPSWFSHEAIGSKVQYEYPQHWNYNKLSGIALCVVISFQTCQDQSNKEEEHTNYLSVKFTCQGITGEESCGQIAWKVGSWNEQRNKREAIESEHVFIGYTNCVHLIKHHEAKKASQCAPTVAFLEFSVTDENTSGGARVEVLKSGLSFVFEPDEKKKPFQDANAVASTSGSEFPRTNGDLTDEANV
ncbi:hypothetical protein F2Q68_00000614 [Brassica cretica]|uniref:ADP-ribosyl cyclase/cyclic ADP-ribose hydrolase n=1 Tax=Brassica cretica TaxID=69181 RepID=A0A8S9JI60_BRACR|nr:hypothetical protein F2Q68_00000614 [Brassica cretica]